jgi:hypothetical protein
MNTHHIESHSDFIEAWRRLLVVEALGEEFLEADLCQEVVIEEGHLLCQHTRGEVQD